MALYANPPKPARHQRRVNRFLAVARLCDEPASAEQRTLSPCSPPRLFSVVFRGIVSQHKPGSHLLDVSLYLVCDSVVCFGGLRVSENCISNGGGHGKGCFLQCRLLQSISLLLHMSINPDSELRCSLLVIEQLLLGAVHSPTPSSISLSSFC